MQPSSACNGPTRSRIRRTPDEEGLGHPLHGDFGFGDPLVSRLRILDSSGTSATNFDLDGGVRLHLIVVRRDLTGYQHLHPRVALDGSLERPRRHWRRPAPTAPMPISRSTVRRRFSAPTSSPPGRSSRRPPRLPRCTRALTATTSSSCTVRCTPARRASSPFRVRRGGQPVTRFDEYIGRRGHLVALHEGDLAYTHVHPISGAPAGEISFDAELAAAGQYRLFLQFKTGGVVHTLPFAAQVAR